MTQTQTSVVVLTNERDFAADVVIEHLSTKTRAHVIRMNAEATLRGAIPAIRLDDQQLSCTSVWWRQFELEVRTSSLTELDDYLVERAQWRAWLAVLNACGASWMNPLWEARRAENKIEQLRSAKSIGFSIPPTLVTNSRSDAKAFATAVGACVVKTVSTGYFEFTDQSFVFTSELLNLERSTCDADWYRQPLLVQKEIERRADVRVISFGNLHFGALCRAHGPDWRLRSGDVVWEKWPVPNSIAKKCDEYLAAMGLRFAAFDFALDDDHCWFLEANQAGEWLFLDRPLELGIADALADNLVQAGHGAG